MYHLVNTNGNPDNSEGPWSGDGINDGHHWETLAYSASYLNAWWGTPHRKGIIKVWKDKKVNQQIHRPCTQNFLWALTDVNFYSKRLKPGLSMMLSKITSKCFCLSTETSSGEISGISTFLLEFPLKPHNTIFSKVYYSQKSIHEPDAIGNSSEKQQQREWIHYRSC